MDFETFSELLHYQIIAALSSTRSKGYEVYCNTGFGANIVISDETVTDIKDEGTIGDIKDIDTRRAYFASEFKIKLEDQLETLARFYEGLKPGQGLLDMGSSVMAFHITSMEQKRTGVSAPTVIIEFTFSVGGSKTEAQTIEII